MDKVFSARIDESIAGRIDMLARELHTTKKHVIESAINQFYDKVSKEHEVDVIDQAHGAWQRKEAANTTVSKSRKAFRDSMTRHHK